MIKAVGPEMAKAQTDEWMDRPNRVNLQVACERSTGEQNTPWMKRKFQKKHIFYYYLDKIFKHLKSEFLNIAPNTHT